MKSLVLMTVGAVLCAEIKAAESTNATDSKPKAASRATELFGDSVVAKGKGVEIKRSQLDDEFIRAKSQAAAERGHLKAGKR